MILVLAAMALAGTTAPVVAVEQSQAWIKAEANRSEMKKPPAFIDGPKAELPEAEKAQGHHGDVVVQGIIGIDGRMKEARVRTSSGVTALDEIALAAARASTLTPAKDITDASIPVVISMPFEFVAYKSATGGLFDYKCGQFVRDMDWWRSVNPEKTFKDHELYRMELGFQMLSLIQRARGNHQLLQKNIRGFDDKWNATMELCRRKPDILQHSALQR